MFIDIGVRSKADAEQYGIEIGNMITPYSEFEQLANGKYLTAKAFDNRYGCALTIDVLNNLKDESIGINLYAGGTVQEEVGLRGAKVAANKINPDLAIAVDVAVAYDTPGMAQYGSDTAIGDGPVIILMDASNVAHQGLRQHIKEVAKNIILRFNGILHHAVVQMLVVSMLLTMVFQQLLLVWHYAICTQMYLFFIQMIMKIQYD